MNCTRALGRPISLISLSPALALSNSGWPRANCAHPRRLRNQQLTLSLQQMQQLRQLGAASCFDTFWAQQKLCPKVGSAQKSSRKWKSSRKIEQKGGCCCCDFEEEELNSWACVEMLLWLKSKAQLSLLEMINFFVLYATFGFLSYRCFALSFGLAQPGLLLLVCRSLRYYFAIHFCLTQFQFQFSFSFSSSCLHFIIIWIHSWQKRNEMKWNETKLCNVN